MEIIVIIIVRANSQILKNKVECMPLLRTKIEFMHMGYSSHLLGN